jgi:hypothetical protein
VEVDSRSHPKRHGGEPKNIHEVMIAKFAQMPCVSLDIDAGTMEEHHFLDVMALVPHPRIRPFLYDAFESATLTAKDDRTIVMAAIKELCQKRVNVPSSVGDDLPAQVTTLLIGVRGHVYHEQRNHMFTGLNIPRVCVILSSWLWVI